MVITKLMGGMGNQMFQFAIGYRLAKHLNTEVLVDLSFLNNTSHISDFVQRKYCLDIFKHDIQILDSQELRKLFVIEEDCNHNFIEDIEVLAEGIYKKYDIYLSGYFQKSIYTDIIKNDLFEIFTIKENLTVETQELLEEIKLTNSICVNFRREFGGSQEDASKIEAPSANQFHGVYGMEYFNEAIKNLEKDIKYDIDKLYVFSDDIKWCEENFKSNYPFKIVSHDYKGNKFGQYLMLMSHCKSFIIPNSSFAWWAAYLSNNDNKIVIAPQRWMNNVNIQTQNICPSNWKRI